VAELGSLGDISMASSYWSLVEPVWDQISIYDGAETFLSQFAKSPPVARTLFAAHWCQSEVLNGGFGQFFGNSTGVLAPEAAVAFDSIGMHRAAQLVKNAMEWFGPQYPRDRGSREELLERYFDTSPEGEDPFKAIDDAFFDLIDEEAGGFEAAANEFSRHHAA
jgi:hypothetical protein